MGFVNSLLKHWGLCVKSHKNMRNKKTNNVINLHNYYLNYYQILDIYL